MYVQTHGNDNAGKIMYLSNSITKKKTGHNMLAGQCNSYLLQTTHSQLPNLKL